MCYRLGLEKGFVSLQEIEAWADSILATDHPYETWLEELSYASKRGVPNTYSVLGTVPGTSTPESLWCQLKALLKTKLADRVISPRSVVSCLYWHSHDDVFPTEVEETIIGFELDYECVDEGYGDAAQVDTRVFKYIGVEQDAPADAKRPRR